MILAIVLGLVIGGAGLLAQQVCAAFTNAAGTIANAGGR